MGWASGFTAGTNMSKQWLDTYNTAERRRLFEEAQKATPLQRFTAQQGDELRRASEAVDAQGQKLYDISIAPGTTEYQVRPISYGSGPLAAETAALPPGTPSSTMYAVPTEPFVANPRGLGDTTGEANYDGPVAANPERVARQGLARELGPASAMAPSVTEYLGKTYEGKFTPEMQRAGLMNRYADIISRDDPIQGENLRMTAEKYARETADYNEQKDIKIARRVEAKRLQGLNPDELVKELGAEFSKDGSGVDAMLTYDPKSKQFLFASNVPGMPSQVLSKAELVQYAMGVWEQGNGDYGAGLKQVIDTVKSSRDIDKTNFDRSSTFATLNANLKLKQEELANQRALIAARAAEMNRTRFANVGLDADGQPVYVDMNRTQIGPDGRLVLPKGLQTMKLPQTLSDVDKALLGKALDALAELPEDASQSEKDRVFSRFGLDPKRFGGSGGLTPTGRFGGGN